MKQAKRWQAENETREDTTRQEKRRAKRENENPK